MTITQILERISQKRVACIMQDRPDTIPLLDQLVHLAIEVDKAKEHPHLYELEEKKKKFYELLGKLPPKDRPFKLPTSE